MSRSLFDKFKLDPVDISTFRDAIDDLDSTDSAEVIDMVPPAGTHIVVVDE